MLITKKHISRRTLLRGMGVSLALPLLDSMVPALMAQTKTAAKATPRLGFVYIPHGAIMDQWTPATEGAGFEFTRILKPLEPFRDCLNVVSGLGHHAADTTAVHSLSPTTWLSGVRPKPTQGQDAFAGVTADQIAALHLGQDTMLPSLELAVEDHAGLIGSCDRDYGCIYMNTLSWRTPTTPLPMEINPRKVFERMFGQGGSVEERAARSQEDRSILDAVAKEAGDLQRTLGPNDKATLSDYLDNVREIERRIQRAGTEQAGSDLSLPDAPAGIPFSYEEHVKLMYDLLALAYQANVTRVATFMVAREVSNRTYPQIGVPDGHHATSHHQNKPEKIEKLVKIQQYHLGLFAAFLKKLQETKDGDGTLLDHSIILYGSNMSNSNLHNHFPLPNIVVGGGAGRIAGGRHLRYEDHTPMTNLLLTLLDKSGVPMDNLGDSTGKMAEL
ncbi:MAG TPA: DUF1552 domain-containing protein [Bryobacteraceae bacterium]|nr:DUF1552 domain-containing protein [Bryobacteraceae bacterium]